MAVTALGDQLTEWHVTQQNALAAAILQIILSIFPGFDLSSFAAVDASWPALELALRSAIEAGYGASSALAATYYDLFRTAEGLEPLGALPADFLPAEQLNVSLKVTGPYLAKSLIANGDALAEAKTLMSLMGSTSRLALSGGRNTILDNGKRDKRLLGYQRVCSSPRPCAWCRMLRSRGPVYLSERSAEFAGNGSKYHDHCHCTPQAVYSTDTNWVSGAKEDRILWNEVTNGLSGKDAINAFRQAVAAGR